MRRRWMKLRYWQKGAASGSGFYLAGMFLLHLAFWIFVPTEHIPGSGDMGPLSAWILMPLYWLINGPPLLILYIFSKAFSETRDILNSWAGNAMSIWAGNTTMIWEFITYLFYSAVIYAFLGMAITIVIQYLRDTKYGPKAQ